jgi:hypothetical protein
MLIIWRLHRTSGWCRQICLYSRGLCWNFGLSPVTLNEHVFVVHVCNFKQFPDHPYHGWHVDSTGFWQWRATLGITGFLDLSIIPYYKEHNFSKTGPVSALRWVLDWNLLGPLATPNLITGWQMRLLLMTEWRHVNLTAICEPTVRPMWDPRHLTTL